MKLLIHNIHLIPLLDILKFRTKVFDEENPEKICKCITRSEIWHYLLRILVKHLPLEEAQ